MAMLATRCVWQRCHWQLSTVIPCRLVHGETRDWEWDEIVLACDLVMLNDWQQIGAEDPRVVELSNLLQGMPLHPQEDRQHNFRNANGVARKTADIATSALTTKGVEPRQCPGPEGS